MRARLMAEKPQDIEFTLKITMRAKEWEELRDQLNNGYPSWKLSQAITSLLVDARKTFYADDPDGKEVTS